MTSDLWRKIVMGAVIGAVLGAIGAWVQESLPKLLDNRK